MADKLETIGYGTIVYIDDGTSHAYVAVDNLVDCDPPAEKLGTVESKRLNITAGVIVSVPTLFDPGEVSLRQQFTQLGFSRVETLRKAKTKSNFKFSIPDDTSTTVVIAPGYITQNKTSKVEADKITEFVTTFKVAGACS
jgi:hypothetical protein